MIRYSLLLALLCTGLHDVTAQIIITMDDERPVLETTRSTTYTARSISGKTFSLGGSGAAKVFDLTGMDFSAPSQEWIDARTINGSLQFPTATHRILTVYGAYPSWFSVVEYFQLDATGRYYLGKYSTWPDGGTPHYFVLDPPRTDYVFPCTLGSTWSYNDPPDTTGSGGYGKYWSAATVEAAGTLRLPIGDFQCLRIFRRERTEFGRFSLHEFVTKGNLRVYLQVDTLDEFSDEPRITSLRIVVHGVATGTGDRIPEPGGIALHQNFPNPISAASGWSTTMIFDSDVSSDAVLDVFDGLGRQVDRVAGGRFGPGRHTVRFDAAKLPAGIYFAVLRAGAITRRIAMTVVR